MTSRPVAKVIVKTKLDLTGGGHTLAPPPLTRFCMIKVYMYCVHNNTLYRVT